MIPELTEYRKDHGSYCPRTRIVDKGHWNGQTPQLVRGGQSPDRTLGALILVLSALVQAAGVAGPAAGISFLGRERTPELSSD